MRYVWPNIYEIIESNDPQILSNIPDDVEPYLDCFTVVPVGYDAQYHLDALIQRLSPGLGYQDPELSDYDIILAVKKPARGPKAGWKIDISWRPVMTLFLWQISHYKIKAWETGSEIHLAWKLINALTQQKGKSVHRMTPERCIFISVYTRDLHDCWTPAGTRRFHPWETRR